MKRRKFMIASGSAVLSGVVASRIQRPAVGLDFEISTPDKDPSEVDSLLIEFETLKITPKYIDENEPVNVQAKVEVNGRIDKSNEVQTSVVNGETKNLENSIDSIVVDGLNASSTIYGVVTVSIDHPDIQDSYSRQFYVNSSEISDSVVYHFGGDDSSNRVDTIYEYDPSTDSILTQSATLPNGFSNSVASSVNNKIYHFGGDDGSNDVDDIYEYDPSTDSISTQSATLPTGLSQATSVAVNDKIYHFGGFDDNSNPVDTIYEYDPSTDSISTRSATLPTALSGATSASV
jgi:hypothetical protein